MGKYFFAIFISFSGCVSFPVHVSFPVRSRTRLGDAAPLGLAKKTLWQKLRTGFRY